MFRPFVAGEVRLDKQADKSSASAPGATAAVSSLTSGVVRGPLYLFGVVLLFFVTVLVYVAMFTNNWQKTATSLVVYQSFTQGLWFTCRVVQISWLPGQKDTYCSTSNFGLNTWIFAVQVFYTLSALLNLATLVVALYGLCRDFGRGLLAVPSFIFWTLCVSDLSQLIAISVYGGKGIADYSANQPDYSIIVASVALLFNFICGLFFLAEIVNKSSKQAQFNEHS